MSDYTNEEIRVLGCLIEKSMATPDYYPLSLNALVNACNQKSNRDPVVSWNEETIHDALDRLKTKNLIFQSNLSRVPKYEETFVKESNLIPREAAILCILMLRGPQTAGEIRSRTERLSEFDSLEAVNDTLETLIEQEKVVRLDRQPGRKEVRYTHTFATEDPAQETIESVQPKSDASDMDTPRIEALEEQVNTLTRELQALKTQFSDFQKQFE